MEWLAGGLINFILSLLVGFWAGSKGRSSLGWFLISILTTPLIGSVALLIAGDKKKYLPY